MIRYQSQIWRGGRLPWFDSSRSQIVWRLKLPEHIGDPSPRKREIVRLNKQLGLVEHACCVGPKGTDQRLGDRP